MMVINRGFRIILLLAYFGLLLTGCSPVTEALHRLVESSGPEPTSVVLTYRTPKPTTTPQVTSTPVPTATRNSDPDFYYGGLTISMDDVGKTVSLRKGQSFSLYLGGDYTWQVESSPKSLISQNVKITPAPGEQGIFIARERGRGVLKAVGEPICRQAQPPCERPSILFQVTVVVE